MRDLARRAFKLLEGIQPGGLLEHKPAHSLSASGAGGAAAGGGVDGGALLPLADVLEDCVSSDDDGEFGAVPAVLLDDLWPEGDAGVLEVAPGNAAADELTVATEEAVLTSFLDGDEGAEGEADTTSPLPHGLECSLAMAADRATISEMGYVTCDVGRWSAYTVIGRITEWPRERPEHLRNVSMRCYVHSRCSLAKVRGAVTNRDLLEWLFAAEPPPHGRVPASVMADLRQAHKAVECARRP